MRNMYKRKIAAIGHNKTIDFIKGICILFIIITHFIWDDNERLRYLFPFYIDMAVPIFMIISGYLNALSFNGKNMSKISDAYTIKEILSKFF